MWRNSKIFKIIFIGIYLFSFLLYPALSVKAADTLPVGDDCDAIMKFIIKKVGFEKAKEIKSFARFVVTDDGSEDDNGNPMGGNQKQFCVPVTEEKLDFKYIPAGKDKAVNIPYPVTNYVNLVTFGVIQGNYNGLVIMEGFDTVRNEYSSISKILHSTGAYILEGVGVVGSGVAIGAAPGAYIVTNVPLIGDAFVAELGVATAQLAAAALGGAIIGSWINNLNFWKEDGIWRVQDAPYLLVANPVVPVNGRARYVVKYEKGDPKAGDDSWFSKTTYYIYFMSKEDANVEQTYGKDCIVKNPLDCSSDSTCFWHQKVDNSEGCDAKYDATICATIKPEKCGTESGSTACEMVAGACVKNIGVNSYLDQYKVPDNYIGPLPPCAFKGTCDNTNDLVQLIVNTGVKAGLAAVGAFAFFAFIYGGFMMITSFGSAERVKKGQQALVAAVIGFVIAVSAYLVIDFMLSVLQTKDIFRGIK